MISSLYANLLSSTHFENYILHKLNTELNLCRSKDKALELPINLYNKIWSNNLNFVIDNIKDGVGTIDEYADKILLLAPSWLTYGSNENMKSDIVKVLTLSKHRICDLSTCKQLELFSA